MPIRQPPPVIPRRSQESGVFEVEQEPGRKPRLRLRKAQRRLPVGQPENLRIPYSDDWKSPLWVLSYGIVGAVLFWILTR